VFDHKDLWNVNPLGIIPVYINCRDGNKLSPPNGFDNDMFTRILSHLISKEPRGNIVSVG